MRPTELNFVPRIWETLFGEFQREVDRRLSDSAPPARPSNPRSLVEQRQYLLGGRCIVAMTGSAPTSAGAEGLGRIAARDASDGRLRLHRSRDGVVRRRSATSAGHRLQTGRRSGSGLLRHRPAVSARRVAAQDREHVPRLLQAARGDRRRVRRRRVLPDRRRRRRGRSRPAGVCRPPQQRAEARAGRVRHPREAGGGLRQQPTGPPDLRLRQQRTPLPVGGRGPHRRTLASAIRDAQAADCRFAAERRESRPACSPTRCRATSSSRQPLSRWRTVCSPASASWRGRS